MYFRIIIFFTSVLCVSCAPALISGPPVQITINTEEHPNGTIEFKLLQKQHHLFIGRCSSEDEILHQENVILYNDGKSHVAAGIRMNVEADVYISCVKIYDQIADGQGGYPSFVSGGVGYNYVEFNVITAYGKGFHFFVQILGHANKENNSHQKSD